MFRNFANDKALVIFLITFTFYEELHHIILVDHFFYGSIWLIIKIIYNVSAIWIITVLKAVLRGAQFWLRFVYQKWFRFFFFFKIFLLILLTKLDFFPSWLTFRFLAYCLFSYLFFSHLKSVSWQCGNASRRSCCHDCRLMSFKKSKSSSAG